MGGKDTDLWQMLPILSTTSNGIITSFNPASEYLLGFNAVDVVGMFPLVAFHDPAELNQRMAGASELQTIGKDSTVRVNEGVNR